MSLSHFSVPGKIKLCLLGWLLVVGLIVALQRGGWDGTLRLNAQMIVLAQEAVHAVSLDQVVRLTPRLQQQARQLEAEYDRLPPQAARVLVTLGIWADNPAEAYRWLQLYPQAWDRVTLPEANWRTLSVISFENIGQWRNRRAAAYVGWLTGFRLLDAGDYEAALRRFRRGLVLAPGRVPDSVRLAYYRALGKWYASQPANPESLRLVQKFACLAEDRPDCLDLDSTAWLEGAAPAWSLPASGDSAYFSDDGWRLVGSHLDEDVLVAGVEVRGLLYWEQSAGEQVERRVQPFAAPNLVPNPGFEFEDLFVDACVNGYIDSHAYVLPCISHAVVDPYGQRLGHVAVTESKGFGYALFPSSVPVAGGRPYLLGGWLCADGAAAAGIGREWLTETLPPEERADGIQWLISQGNDPKRPFCWAQHTRVVWIPSGAEEFGLRLQRLGGDSDTLGRAMFDDLFFFELPSRLDAGARPYDTN